MRDDWWRVRQHPELTGISHVLEPIKDQRHDSEESETRASVHLSLTSGSLQSVTVETIRNHLWRKEEPLDLNLRAFGSVSLCKPEQPHFNCTVFRNRLQPFHLHVSTKKRKQKSSDSDFDCSYHTYSFGTGNVFIFIG